MEELILQGLNILVALISQVFDIIFFWLPDDPLTNLLENWDVVSAANAQAIRWLNWFVDVPFAATVFAGFVWVFLAFAVWKIIKVIINATFKAVEAVPVVE